MQTGLARARPALEDAAFRAMFAARKQVFVDLLKWDLPVLAGAYEVDQFDHGDAEYLILLDSSGLHCASARLLPTDGSHLLGDLYPFLCDGPIPAGPRVREITRFCLDRRQTASERRIARDQLVTALAEHALRTGITGYTGVAELGWFSQILAFGWNCVPLGQPVSVDGHMLAALYITIDGDTLDGLRSAGVYRALTFTLAGGKEGRV